jgi:hypothetical protein
MTETQRKFLTEYLGECFHSESENLHCVKCGLSVLEIANRRTFTTAQDKQDLLMGIISNGEWIDFRMAYAGRECCADYSVFFIKLSPEATAELICKWKGVE